MKIFPRDLLTQTKYPEPLFLDNQLIGYIVGKEIYINTDEFPDLIGYEVSKLIKKYNGVLLEDDIRKDRYYIYLVTGHKIFFTCSYFCYNYIKIKYLLKDKVTSDGEDIHFGVNLFKYLNKQIPEERLHSLVQYLWEEAVR